MQILDPQRGSPRATEFRARQALACGLIFLCLSFNCSAETIVGDSGRLQRLRVGRGWLNVQSDVKIPLKGWKGWLNLASSNPKQLAFGNRRTWTGSLLNKPTAPDTAVTAVDVQQSIVAGGERLIFEIKATALEDADIEGVIFNIELPPAQFVGGIYAAGTELGELPLTPPEPNHIANTNTSTLAFTDSSRKAKVKLEFDRPVQVLFQDERKWGGNYSAFIYVQSAGILLKGQSAQLRVTVWTGGDVEAAPANLSMNVKEKLYRVWGIGGSYCFNLGTPMTPFTFENLQPAFSRTQMSLRDWEPLNDNGDPHGHDWREFKSRDRNGSALRHEFEMMRELSRRGIPYASSIWYCPKWMYVKDEETEYNNQVARDKWPELLESIGTYLLYAKEKYDAEPDYFSFNEPDSGVHVLFSAEEHRDFIKAAGAHFKRLKLRTKLLLGDVANPRNTHWYISAAAADPEAMKHVAALSFHSWGGATPEQYAKWRQLADELDLPLFVGEAGPEANWNIKPWQQPDAAGNEMAHYQNIFLHARPQAIAYWEFTDNFPLLGRDSQKKLLLTERYCLQKHWSEFIPPGSEGVQTSSDNGQVLFTAFRHKPRSGPEHYTLHVANPKWSRHATISGIPKKVKVLNVVRTSPGELFKQRDAVAVENGTITLDLPTQSLTTLTTMEIPELEKP